MIPVTKKLIKRYVLVNMNQVIQLESKFKLPRNSNGLIAKLNPKGIHEQGSSR